MTPETLDYFFSEYQKENELLRGCAYRTIRTYRESYDCWRSIGSPLDTNSLRAGLLSLRERGLKPSSVNQRLRCWMIFLRWLHQRGHIEHLPKVQMLPTIRTIIQVFDSRQCIAVLRVKPTRDSIHRAQSMFALSLDTALRFGEMASLLRSGIDRTAMMLSVDGKVGARRVPVSAEGLRWIIRYASRHPHQRVYATHTRLLMDHTNSLRHLRALFERLAFPPIWHNGTTFAGSHSGNTWLWLASEERNHGIYSLKMNRGPQGQPVAPPPLIFADRLPAKKTHFELYIPRQRFVGLRNEGRKRKGGNLSIPALLEWNRSVVTAS